MPRLRRFVRAAGTAGIGALLVACGAGGPGPETTDASDPSPVTSTPAAGSHGGPDSEQIGIQDRVTIEVSDP